MSDRQMARRAGCALFLSGLFFGGGLDHVIYAATGTPTSHYGLRLDLTGQLAFAVLDFGLMTLLLTLHFRWSR